MKKLLLSLSCMLLTLSAASQGKTNQTENSHNIEFNQEITSGVPSSPWGTVRRFSAPCKALDTTFTIDVLLPEGYDPERAEGYPVIYANDGQNLFDNAIAFGGQSWDLGTALQNLREENLISEPIIVGIHNREQLRPADYIPEKVCTEYIPSSDRDKSGMWTLTDGTFNADEYVDFIAGTVKENIDRLFNTAPESPQTFVMGSSMGALSALYAMCEYPEVFGGAACLSTHWIGDFNYSNTIFPQAMASYLSDRLPSPSDHKLYLDRGTEDLDAAYKPHEAAMRELVRGKGYDENSGSLYTFTDEGATHNEYYWARRVNRPLYFMLGLPGTSYDPENPVEKEYHVVFCDSRYQWTAPAAFTWTGATGILQLGSWPGTKMSAVTYNGQPAWEISFKHMIAPTNIIFNDGRASGAVQTKDLPFRNNYVYNFDGPVSPVSAVDGIDSDDAGLEIIIGKSEILIHCLKTADITLSRIDGTGYTIRLQPGENRISAPVPGIYILAAPGMGARKVVLHP